MKKHDAATKVVSAIVPIDLASGAQQGAWVSLGKYDSLTVIYQSDAGTNNQDVNVSLRQAKTSTGGSPKNLNRGQWYASQHATSLSDSFSEAGGGDGKFTDDGETRCIARVEVTADQLDVDNDYSFVQVRTTDPGATAGKFGSAVYVLRGARWSIKVDEQPTALA